MANDSSAIFETARSAYEWGRFKRACFDASPLLILPVVSWVLTGKLASMVGLGSALVICAIVFLWRGQGFGRSVPIGLRFGLIPLGLAHLTRVYGHVCTPSGCTSLCIPACTAGGIIAGALVAHAARKSISPKLTLFAASGVAFLTGALGCACVGFGGVLGLFGGLTVTLIADRLYRH